MPVAVPVPVVPFMGLPVQPNSSSSATQYKHEVFDLLRRHAPEYMGPIELSELQVQIEELTMSYDTNIFFHFVPELAKMMIKEDDVYEKEYILLCSSISTEQRIIENN